MTEAVFFFLRDPYIEGGGWGLAGRPLQKQRPSRVKVFADAPPPTQADVRVFAVNKHLDFRVASCHLAELLRRHQSFHLRKNVDVFLRQGNARLLGQQLWVRKETAFSTNDFFWVLGL